MPHPDSDQTPLPRGLVFFAPTAGRAYRRRRVLFILIGLVLSVAVIGPVYALASRVTPLVFGLPFSFAWVIFALVVSFVALLWLYQTESHTDTPNRPAT